MSNDWRNYIVQTRWIVDNAGKEHHYQIPPSWKLELQIWDIFSAFDLTPQLASELDNVDRVIQAVALILDLKTEFIEDNFAIEDIEGVFMQVWQAIAPSDEDVAKLDSVSVQKLQESFSINQVLGMLAAECGWDPQKVLEMPRCQVIPLAEAISEYLAQRLKFQAAIHGVDVDEGAKGAVNTQIEDETYWRDLSKELPVEVK